jgi:K+-sensing histidine kinase KdpD
MAVEEEVPTTLDELKRSNKALERELEALKLERQVIWPLLVETSRRLQASSASIKAAVSSLLSYDIFWDSANQHEFLKTIDTSVDQVGKLSTLFSLAFRLEAGTLVLKRELQNLQEILTSAQANAAFAFPNLDVELILPQEGKPVEVDFEYLTLTLTMLFEVFASRVDGKKITVRMQEAPAGWSVHIDGLDQATVELIRKMHFFELDSSYISSRLSPENAIRLHIVSKLFHLQDIQVDSVDRDGVQAGFYIHIPAAKVS